MKAERKNKKKFSFKRFLKRLLIVFGILSLTLLFAFKYTINSLKENGIQYSNIDYSFPLGLEIDQFTINQEDFQLILKKVKLDLSISNLFSGKISGDNFFAKDLYIIYTFEEEEEPEEEPFNFDFMPYLAFENVQIENTIIRTIDSTDFSIFTFPIVTAQDFIWNDSIYASKVDYSNGTIAFLQPFTSDSTDTSQTKIEVIPYVPHFYADEFNTDSLDFILANEDSYTKISTIDFSINGWNNIPGVDLAINHLYFTVQDSLHLKVDSSRFVLEADKSLAIQDFNIKVPGIDFNLKEFRIENIDDDFAYSIILNESHFSPRYAKYFGAEEYIKTDAPDISLQFNANYFKDTLRIHSLDCLLANKTQILIDGQIAQPSEIGDVNLNITEINITENNLKQYFDVDAPESMENLNLNSKLNVHGNKDKLSINGNIDIDKIHSTIQVQFFDLLNEKINANLDIQSPYISSNTFQSTDSESSSIDAFGIEIQTKVRDFNPESIDNLTFEVQIDSLKNDDYTFNEIDLFAKYKDEISSIIMKSDEDDWNITLNTHDAPFNFSEIKFFGNADINTEKLKEFEIKPGRISTNINGELQLTDNINAIGIHFDSLLFKTNENEYLDFLEIQFLNSDSTYSISVIDSNNVHFKTTFTEKLITWVNSSEKSTENIPDFDLNLSLNIDTTFIRDFAGVNTEVKIEEFKIIAKENKVHGNTTIPLLQYDSSYVKNISGELILNEKQQFNAFHIDTLNAAFVYLNDINTRLEFKDQLNIFHFLSTAFSPKIQDSLQLNTQIAFKEDSYQFYFDSLHPQRIGESYWYSKNSDSIRIDKNDYAVTGIINFISDEQSIHAELKEEEVDLKIDSLHLGEILVYYIPSDSIHSTLNMDLSYKYDNNAINGSGRINEIIIDTIDVGSIDLAMNYTQNDQKANVFYQHDLGFLEVNASKLYDAPKFVGKISEIELNSILKLANLDTLQLQTKGKISGEINGNYTDSLIVSGFIQFDSTEFNAQNYGFKSYINQQKIHINNNYLSLNNFTVKDHENNTLLLNGKMDVTNPSRVNIDLVTDHFILLNNLKKQENLRGEFDIVSNLHFTSENNVLLISGFLNTLDGNKIEYIYESEVTLNDRSKTVTFMDFDKPDNNNRKVENRNYRIDYDVDINLGKTELYVLLSQTANEYFRLNCFGELFLENGKGMEPSAFGKLESINGFVYYEAPVVSDIKLNIEKANLKWEGDLFNPKIDFLGTEVFHVFPNEVSADLTSDGERVPVKVDVIINNHTLDDFQINFDIESNQEDVQNYLASQTANTRSDYAVSMLVYGKINRDAESSKSGYEAIVGKLNELARRNFKNTDVSFRVEKYPNKPGSAKSNYNKVGFDLSRNFLKDNLRVTVGGSMRINGGSTSNMFGYAKVSYQVSEKPNTSVMVSHTNQYKGPLFGRVNQTSAGVEFKFEFDNILKNQHKNK